MNFIGFEKFSNIKNEISITFSEGILKDQKSRIYILFQVIFFI